MIWVIRSNGYFLAIRYSEEQAIQCALEFSNRWAGVEVIENGPKS